jgi:hypothetical protein
MTVQDQQRIALDKANTTRVEMSRLRREIRNAGHYDGPAIAARVVMTKGTAMTFWRLLLAVPAIGEIKAEKMLRTARINPTHHVDSRMVDQRRRMLLADLLLGRSHQ